MRLLFRRRDSDQNDLEQRMQKLSDLHIKLGREVAEIKALLHRSKGVEMTPDQQALSTIEEQIIMLAKVQEALTRQVAELKAILEGRPGNIQSGETHRTETC